VRDCSWFTAIRHQQLADDFEFFQISNRVLVGGLVVNDDEGRADRVC